MKKYGLIVADIGTAFAISGTNDPRFDNSFSGYNITFRADAKTPTLRLLDSAAIPNDIKWSNFEIIKMGSANNAVKGYHTVHPVCQ